MPLNDFSRQKDLMDVSKALIYAGEIHLIGAGAVGSWVALFLAKLGLAKKLRVYDFDVVEEHNVPNQAYDMGDVGMYKVLALRGILEDTIGESLPAENFKIKEVRGKDFRDASGVVITVADSMDVRRDVAKVCLTNYNIEMYLEARMDLDDAQVYVIHDPTRDDVFKRYLNTLSYDVEPEEGTACQTSKTAITTAVLTAEVIVRNIVRYINYIISEADLAQEFHNQGMLSLDRETNAQKYYDEPFKEIHVGFNKMVAIGL